MQIASLKSQTRFKCFGSKHPQVKFSRLPQHQSSGHCEQEVTHRYAHVRLPHNHQILVQSLHCVLQLLDEKHVKIPTLDPYHLSLTNRTRNTDFFTNSKFCLRIDTTRVQMLSVVCTVLNSCMHSCNHEFDFIDRLQFKFESYSFTNSKSRGEI